MLFEIFPLLCILFSYNALDVQHSFYINLDKTASMKHNLQKYCKWILFVQ